MSCTSFRHVLALLHDNEQEMWDVLERAVDLAEMERARLTLAKTTDPGRLVRWFGPLTPLCRLAPIAEPDLARIAGRRLAKLAETVPASTPLCTVLLTADTTGSLRQVAQRAPFDLVVVSSTQLAHGVKLRRELRRLGVCTLAVTSDEFTSGAAHEPLMSEGFDVSAPSVT
jgi:hypothetical protein